jgi:hypothetical protein
LATSSRIPRSQPKSRSAARKNATPPARRPRPLPTDVQALQRKVRALEREVARLKPFEPEVLILRDISREQAKREIKELFATGKTLYYSDIEIELGIGLETVVEICNELMEAGEIDVRAENPV